MSLIVGDGAPWEKSMNALLIKIEKIKNKGFTLIELLVVMAIIAVLTMLGVSNFRNVQRKARDAQRKSDLAQLQRALELYYNDYGVYPDSSNGKINLSGELEWKTAPILAEAFTDGTTIYMKEIVGDPSGNPQYCYLSNNHAYQVYARLENTNDPSIGAYSCEGIDYNFELSSPDVYTTPIP